MRSRFLLTIIMALALSILFLAGCTDKTPDNPTRPVTPEHGLAWLNPFRFYSIVLSTSMDPGYMVSKVYTPPGYDWQGGGGTPYPVLYMLSPFRGDELYYFEHGLADVADRLLAEGKIQPMLIVCIDGRSQLGGSFYTDSPQQGKYFSAITTDETYQVNLLIDPRGDFVGTGSSYRGPWTLESPCQINRIDDWYLTIPEAGARAVCGVGMGGYGAFKLALETDMFSSVSAVNAPLDFDGSGNNGFISLINDIIPSQWTHIDTSNTGRVDTIYTVDTSLSNDAMSLIVSASAAFSPQYTQVRLDSMYVTERDSLLVPAFTPIDSLTGDRISYLPLHQIHVPFDSLGHLNNFIWNVWMQNNLQNIYQADVNGTAAQFDTIPKLLIESRGAEFHYEEQMDAFIEFLRQNTNQSKLTVMDFKGNQNLTGTADHFLYDLLDDILIFHSNNFDLSKNAK